MHPTTFRLKKLVAFVLPAVIFATSAVSQPVLNLNDAIQLALQNNFDIRIVKNNERIAELQNNWGNAGGLPTVRATGGYNISNSNIEQKLNTGVVIKRNGATLQTENASLTAQYFLFNGFRAVAAKKRLAIQEEIGALQVKQQVNQTVYNVLSAYVTAKRLQQQHAATSQSMLLFAERMKLAENRFNIGVGIKSDFLQAQIDYNQQQNALIELENNIIQSKTFINNLISRNPDEKFTITDTTMQVALPDRSNIIAALDTLSPDLLIARSNELVLLQQHREINALRLPSLALNTGGSFNNNNNSAGQILRNFSYGPAAGVTLSVPIFQGGIIKQQLKVNDILVKNQQLQTEQIKVSLQTTLANAYNSYENAKRQYNLEKSNLELVKENTMIAMERFRKASITTVELRQTQLNLIESQTRMINAEFQMEQAQADVLLVTGRLVQ
jgi:outer membrane protein